ncbi:MAG: hypothetical protein ABI398_03100 [Devosia sp.]
MNNAELELADTAARLKKLYTAAVYDIMHEMACPTSASKYGRL